MNRCLLLGLLLTGAAAADNLVLENSSFETGAWGFDAVPYAWVRAWPTVVQPRVVEETAAHGRYSLRLDNGSGHDVAMVTFPAIPSGGPTPLTISFAARSVEAGTPLQVQLHCGYKTVVDGTVTLDRTWRRYQVSGQVGGDLLAETRNAGRPGWYAPVFRLLPASKPQWKTVWLDAVQVERAATAGAYAPARQLEASLDLADHAVRRLLVYDLGETPTAELRVAAAAAGPFTATWRLRDVLAGQVLAEGGLEGVTDAQGCARATITLPATARRLYRLEATVTAAATADTAATAAPAPATAQRVYGGIANRTHLPGGRFGGSLESFEAGRRHYLAAPDPSFRLAHWREAPEIYAAMARRLGWSWVHLYRETNPLSIMPEPGVFAFTDTDVVVDLLRRHDLEILALLTSHGNYQTTYDFPAWMLTGPASLGGTSAGKGMPLPDLAAWEGWCSAMATRYRGRIAAWETWNEPGVKMREAEYLPYAQAAWRAIKTADPQAMVLGLCGTWDVGGDMYGWLKSCLALGAASTMDAISVHGYHTLHHDYVARVRKLARELSGRDFPVWDTETGFLVQNPYDLPGHFLPGIPGRELSSAAAPAMVAEALVRHTADEIASGVERLSYFNLAAGWTTMGMPDMLLLNFDGAPDMGLIAENFLIETFEKATAYRTLSPAGGVVAHLFSHPDGPLLVYWLEDGQTTTAQLALTGVKLYDLLGGPLPVPARDGGVCLPIDHRPRLLSLPGGDLAAVATAVGDMVVQGLRPLRLETAVLGLRDGQPTLALTLANRTNAPLPVAVTTRQRPAWLEAGLAWQGSLPALASATAVLPLRLGDVQAAGVLRLVADSGSHVLALPLGLPVLTATATPRRWPLADWCSLTLSHDSGGLRLHGEVVDDQVVHHKDCTSATLAEWQGDCVELFFDWEREADQGRPACDGDDTQLFCLPPGATPAAPARVQVAEGLNAGNRAFPIDRVAYQATRTATGWTFDLTIPWSCAEALGCQRRQALGFAASVREVGADWRQRRRVIWAGDDDNYRSTAGYGLLLLR